MSIHEARERLSRLVDKAASGEDVVVCRSGEPVVRITRLDAPRCCIIFGLPEGKLGIPWNFDAPLPDDVVATFEGR